MRNKLKQGFTLIELLVVIGIIVIIASLVIVNVSQARMNGRDAKRISDLKSIQNALEMYYEKNKAYPTPNARSDQGSWDAAPPADSLANSLSTYISPLPKDPMNGKANIKYVSGSSCSTRTSDNNGLAYYYVTNALQDSYKLSSRLEVRCEGLTENDGGGTTDGDSFYELWGGKTGNALQEKEIGQKTVSG